MNSSTKIGNHEIVREIFSGGRSRIYEATRIKDKTSVIIKVHKSQFPSKRDIELYENDFEIGSSFDHPNIVHYYDIETHNHGSAIIEENFNGESLNNCIPDGGFDNVNFLKIAIQLSDGLAAIHDKNVIHKDINPHNIVLNEETGVVKFIDFGIATVLDQEIILEMSPKDLEGTLPYISPEQTGRMNRGVNYLTDFYSLGATFYQLLCGRLPFQTNDLLELIHAQIAKDPTPPYEYNLNVPAAISKIIMKLLAKDANHRYKSARGLKVDLEYCLNELKTKGKIADFELGQNDYSNKFQIPQKLYGRETELKELLEVFNRVSVGGTELLFVSGYSGVGKSALIQEVQLPITIKRGFFVSGKFDQLNRNIAYSALGQALQGLVRQVLGESKEQIAEWKEKLLSSLGQSGQILIDIIPELELIIGKQPLPAGLGIVESQNRFNLIFQKFIGVFTHEDRPLTLFLDDIQWADLASLNLIKLLAVNTEIKHLFLIGAYRDNEVDASHPTMVTIEEIKEGGGTVNDIVLLPLHKDVIGQLISDTFRCDVARCDTLTKLVYDKTNGNPFFVRSLLQSLYDESLLYYDEDANWQWDIEKIKEIRVSDNVVDLILGRIGKLESSTKDVLKLAACLGNMFNTEALSFVSKKTLKEVLLTLRPVMKRGMIFRSNGSFYFAHDKVQEAAYSLIKEFDKKAVHLEIGELLLENFPKEKVSDRIFEIIDHLNLSRELITENQKKIKLASLNLEAGTKAKDSAAYETAFNYLKIGIELLEDGWSNQYDLMLALHNSAIETAYLNTAFDEMDRLMAEVMNNSHSLLDKIMVYEIKIQQAIIQNKPLEAIETAYKVLALLGVKLPKNPGKFDIMLGLIGVKIALARKKTATLIDLPQMQDREKIAAMSILMSVSPAVYTAAPNILPLIAFKMIKLSIKYGNDTVSAYGYTSYGFLLGAVLGDINGAQEFGKLSLQLVDKLKAESLRARIDFMVNSFIKNWKEPAKEIAAVLKNTHYSALELGDVEYGVYSCMTYSYISYFTGKNLRALEPEVDAFRKTTIQMKQETTLNFIEIYHQSILNLMGSTESPWLLKGPVYDEEKNLPLHLEANAGTSLFYLFYNKLCLSYLFEQYQEADKNAVMAEKYLDSGMGTFLIPQYHFYDSLTKLELLPNLSGSEKRKALKKIYKNQKKMKNWAKHAPANFLHKWKLVEAKLAQTTVNVIKTMNYFDQAIKLAQENKWFNDEALANELYAKFWLSQNNETIAQTYIREAHYLYTRWGAQTKVEFLENQYTYLQIESSKAIETIETSSIRTEDGSMSFDLMAVVKGSQAISGEIRLEHLLDKMMRIIIENAGAQQGLLALNHNGELFIEASVVLGDDNVHVLEHTPIRNNENLSEAIVRYIYRTGENVVLHNAFSEGDFLNDLHVIKRKLKSVLGMPIRFKDETIGVLYLENNLASNVFTEKRVDVLQVLVAQAAISLENARLYENIEQKIREQKKIEMKVRELNEGLEQRVAKRTAQLEEANELLSFQKDEIFRKNEEKKTMLKEIHHRVKNNLQVVNSLLALQSRQIDDEKVVTMFEEAQNRVISMAVLHEKMYNSKDLKHIDIKEHFTSLIEILIINYKINTEISLDINIGDIDIGIKTLIPLGLMINEMISNALKHAFNDRDKGTIKVYIKHLEGKKHEMIIGDNGMGIHKDFVFKESTSFGMGLINLFVEQLNGEIDRIDVPGTQFRIIFENIDDELKEV